MDERNAPSLSSGDDSRKEIFGQSPGDPRLASSTYVGTSSRPEHVCPVVIRFANLDADRIARIAFDPPNSAAWCSADDFCTAFGVGVGPADEGNGGAWGIRSFTFNSNAILIETSAVCSQLQVRAFVRSKEGVCHGYVVLPPGGSMYLQSPWDRMCVFGMTSFSLWLMDKGV